MVLNVVRRVIAGRLPELVVGDVIEHHEVPHAPATLGCLPGRRADAGVPPDLCHARPRLVTERASLGLIIEQRYKHKMIRQPLSDSAPQKRKVRSSGPAFRHR